jgi:signal transduction histidine kinase
LAGLRAAIDDLERLARLTLAEPPSGDPSPSATASLAAPIATSPSGSRAPATRDADGRRPGATAGVMAGLEAAVRELGPIHPRVEFALRGTSDARLLAVRLGEMPLQELLTILLRNAVEAMRGAGRCTVDVERQGDRCRISIGDEGEGLPPEAGDRLCTPGFTTKPGGSGFGLFLARRIVEDQGGTLRLVAGAEKGAVAQLELPLASGAGGASADAPEQRGARAEGGVG